MARRSTMVPMLFGGYQGRWSVDLWSVVVAGCHPGTNLSSDLRLCLETLPPSCEAAESLACLAMHGGECSSTCSNEQGEERAACV